MGTLFVDKLDPQSGTSLELGSSGDTISVNTGATTSLLGNVTLGASGKSITVPSGCYYYKQWNTSRIWWEL